MTSTQQRFHLMAAVVWAVGCQRVECVEPFEREGDGCVYRDPWPAACPVNAIAVGLDRSGLVYSSNESLAGGWGFPTPVIESQEEFDDLQRRMIGGVDFAPIDFEQNVLIGAYLLFEGTCGACIVADGIEGASTLVLRIEDTSGSCNPEPCNLDIGRLILYEVPRPVTEATVCAEVWGTCSDRCDFLASDSGVATGR